MAAEQLAPSGDSVLLLLPLAGDARLVSGALQSAGINPEIWRSADGFLGNLGEGVGAAVIAEEALDERLLDGLVAELRVQPPWSELPLIVLLHHRAAPPASRARLGRLESDQSVTLLQRPLAIVEFVSAVRVALRSRARQYQVRDLLRQLEDGVRRRDEFLAMLGHELRNPLAPIAHSAELLGGRAGRASPEEVVRAANVISRQVRHLARLVDDLLDVARVSRGRIALQREPIDLAEAVRRGVELIEPRIREKKQELSVSLPDQPVTVDADPVRIVQVVGNLLANASSYTPEGGRIRVVLDLHRGRARIRVRDNGVGIAPDLLPHVFDLFRQAQGSLARTSQGLGLGLTLVKRIVALHGGDVSARSEGPGQGAEFTVTMTLIAAREPVRAERAFGQAAGRNVLVIEDNRDAAESLATLLGALGQHVEIASTGSDGIATAQRTRPDVVFVDIGLPDIDGYEVARRLRSALPPSTWLVALSGYPAEDGEDCKPFDEHLLKPAPLSELERLLADCGQ